MDQRTHPAGAKEKLKPPSTEELLDVYHRLYDHFGPRNWWPASGPFEVVVGAILTQAVAWRNVEMALANLKEDGMLDPFSLDRASLDEVAQRIVPTRYYRQKAARLKNLCRVLVAEYNGDVLAMLKGDTQEVRQRLLALKGIGPETADSILLYAGGHPIFVVDAYTRRIFHRLGFWKENISYARMQDIFHQALPRDIAQYNEYHALIDSLGNRYCKATNPRCTQCPLASICRYDLQKGIT